MNSTNLRNRCTSRPTNYRREQTALAANRAEIASRQGELQLAREQLGRQHQEFAETKRQELEQLEHRAAELQEAESKLKQAERR